MHEARHDGVANSPFHLHLIQKYSIFDFSTYCGCGSLKYIAKC